MLFGPQKKVVWTAREIAEAEAAQKAVWDYMLSHGGVTLPDGTVLTSEVK